MDRDEAAADKDMERVTDGFTSFLIEQPKHQPPEDKQIAGIFLLFLADSGSLLGLKSLQHKLLRLSHGRLSVTKHREILQPTDKTRKGKSVIQNQRQNCLVE